MNKIIAENGDRLDQIVYSNYGTLSVFEKVLTYNNHLVNKPTLLDGDVVYLPTIEISKETITEVTSLW